MGEQEIKTISYGQNVKNAFGSVIVGVVLFISAVLVLWFNEGNCAANNKIASYVNKNATPVEITSVDKINDNKLITVSGQAETAESLSDGIITVPNALALKRSVEMYQWEEDKKTESKTKVGGTTTETTTYTYDKVWSENEIDSSKFHNTSYSNPPFTLKSERYNAKTGKFGDFVLSDVQTGAIGDLEPYTKLAQNYQYKIFQNYYYKGNNPQAPNIGDVRISYSYMPSGAKISVIGLQRSDKTITPMVSKFGRIYIQYNGLLSQAEMVEKFKKDNAFTTNIFRVFGFLLMFIGLNILLRPLSVLLSFIPLFEKLVSAITGGIVFLISIILSMAIIAVAWLFYRPVAAVCLLVIVVALAVLIKKKIWQK